MKKFVLGVTALLSLTAMSAAPAYAQMNVTGSYSVSLVCKGYDELGIYKTKSEMPVTIDITQNVNDLNVMFIGAISNGRLMLDSDKPDAAGAAAVVSCTVNNDLDYSGLNYNRLGQINFSASGTAIKVKGSYQSGAAISEQFIELCKFKGTRTSEVNPAVGACPP